MSALGYIQKRTRIADGLLNPRHMDIYSTPCQVVRALHAPYRLINGFTSVSAVNHDWTLSLSKGLQPILAYIF